MGQLITRYAGDNSHVGPSPIIWSRFPDEHELLIKPELARNVSFNFMSHAPTFATTAVHQNGLCPFFDTSATIRGNTTLDDGLVFTQPATDNSEASISAGGNIQAAFTVDTATAANNRLLGFECSVAKTSIGDDISAFLAGIGYLTSTNLALAESLVDDTGRLISTANFIGFENYHVNGGTAGQNALVNTILQKASQTKVTIKAAAKTLVASTFVKLGFVYDPGASSDKKITFYLDGVEQTDYVTSTQIAAATFPLSTPLNFYFGMKTGSAAAAVAKLRFARVCQLR